MGSSRIQFTLFIIIRSHRKEPNSRIPYTDYTVYIFIYNIYIYIYWIWSRVEQIVSRSRSITWTYWKDVRLTGSNFLNLGWSAMIMRIIMYHHVESLIYNDVSWCSMTYRDLKDHLWFLPGQALQQVASLSSPGTTGSFWARGPQGPDGRTWPRGPFPESCSILLGWN